MKKPNYKKIYFDLINYKFPEKLEEYKEILSRKRELSVLDIIQLNESIFGIVSDGQERENQRYRSYDKSTIMEILEYQKKNFLNNTQLAMHFKLSRNTVAVWKKRFIV